MNEKEKDLVRDATGKYRTITSLVDEHLSGLANYAHKDLASDLLHPSNGKLQRRILEYRGIGFRRLETEAIRSHLCQRGITSQKVAADFGVDATTVSRAFKGETVSKWWTEIQLRYSEELAGFRGGPTFDEKKIESYRFAVDRLNEKVLKLLEVARPALPAMNSESFCYLWHMLTSQEWEQAERSGDPKERKRTALGIYTNVRDPHTFPTYQTTSPPKSAESLKQIHTRWGLWFRLVVLCS